MTPELVGITLLSVASGYCLAEINRRIKRRFGWYPYNETDND